jgi:uncharacterized protein (TIGR00297 family)
MVSDESTLRPTSRGEVVRTLYSRLRTTFEWSGIVAIVFQAIVLALAFGTGAGLLLLLVGSLVTAASFLENSRRDSNCKDSEPRSWRNALANAGVATGFGALSLLMSSTQGRAIFAVGSVASLAASFSDSLSHEIGVMCGGKPRLITTWRLVEPGENGGVSLVGSVVGIIAAFGLAALAILVGVIGLRGALVAGIAACAGNLIDSILGATVERRGRLGNNGVNFSAAFSSAVLVLLVLLVLNLT